jgi:hypothetical protein
MTKYNRQQALLTDEQLKRLKSFSTKKGVSIAAVLRWAVDAYEPIFLADDSRSSILHERERTPEPATT